MELKLSNVLYNLGELNLRCTNRVGLKYRDFAESFVDLYDELKNSGVIFTPDTIRYSDTVEMLIDILQLIFDNYDEISDLFDYDKYADKTIRISLRQNPDEIMDGLILKYNLTVEIDTIGVSGYNVDFDGIDDDESDYDKYCKQLATTDEFSDVKYVTDLPSDILPYYSFFLNMSKNSNESIISKINNIVPELGQYLITVNSVGGIRQGKQVTITNELIVENIQTELMHSICKFIENESYLDVDFDQSNWDDGDFIDYTTRLNGDILNGFYGEADLIEAKKIKRLLEIKFSNLITVTTEVVDEWVNLNIEIVN